MDGKAKILVVDDEKAICDVVRAYLEREGHTVFCAYDGEAALEAFRRENPNLVVLDRMLPKLSGEAVCVHIRAESAVPVLMLTARAGEDDLVSGLFLGADDYVEKPFRAKELIARISALLRRTGGIATAAGILGGILEPSHESGHAGNREGNREGSREGESGASTASSAGSAAVIRVGTLLELEPDSYEVRCGGEHAVLTGKEFRILHVLARHPKKVFTREELIAAAFPEGYEGFDRAMDTYVKNIRKKLAEAGQSAARPSGEEVEYIRTVHGIGYRMGDVP